MTTRSVRTVRNVGFLAGSEIIGKFGSFLLIVIAARTLGQAGFGVISFGLSTGLLCSVLATWGFDSVVIREGSKDRSHLPALLANSLATRLTIIGLLTVVLALWQGSTRGWNVDTATVIVVAVSTFIDTLTDGVRAGLTALEVQSRPALMLVIQRLVTAAGAALLLVVHGTGIAFAAVLLTGSGIGASLMLRAISGLGFGPDWRALSAREVIGLARMSGYAGVDDVVSMALFRAGAVLLGMLDGDAAVGLYSAGFRLIETVLFAAWSIGRALMPIMSSTEDSRAALRTAWQGVTAVAVLFVPYAVVLLLRGNDIVTLLFGSRYAVGPTVALLAPVPLVFGLFYLFGLLLLARDHTRSLAICASCALVIGVGLNIVLIRPLHAAGAAAATLTSYIVATLGSAILAGRLGKHGPFAPLLPSVLAGVVAALACLLPVSILIAGPVAAVGYLVTWWLLARRIAPQQLELIRAASRRTEK